MEKLDITISNVAYILDSLILLRDITKWNNNCNYCAADRCEYLPDPGYPVRYNCPHFVREEVKDE